MPNSKTADAADQPPFVLKHRVAGAAFLIFFGALVLPWLLGPPSEADRATSTASSSIDAQALSSAQIEDELLDDLAQQPDVEEEVYISKITPLDSQNDALNPRGSESSSQAEDNSKDDSAAAAKRAAEQAATAEATKRQQAEAAAQAEQDAQEKQKRDKAAALAKRQADIEDDLAKALAAEAADVQAVSSNRAASSAPPSEQKAKVEIGWAVQVGLFENKTGADRVVQDLKAKGFNPSVTVVDTNRGKATGTRVWLGPFAQRVDAAKEMSRLSERTGQAGFIRAYP